jgi:hypothetical protein
MIFFGLGQLHVKNYSNPNVEMGDVGGVYTPPTSPKFLVLRGCIPINGLYAIALFF